MKIIEYFTSDNQAHWLEEIRKSDWGAGQSPEEGLRILEECRNWEKQ